MTKLEVYFDSLPKRLCVHCGYCCSKAPCAYGAGVPCEALTEDNKCLLYDDIKEYEQRMFGEVMMFDNECCSPLNTLRTETIATGIIPQTK